MSRLRLRRSERGAELVEFALLVPIFLMVVIACLSLTWLAFMKTAAAQAAKEAARHASTSLTCPVANQPWCTLGERTFPDAATVVPRVNARVPLFDFASTDLSIVYTWRGNNCSLSETCTPPPNALVDVTVSKQVPAPFRFFAGVFGGVGNTIDATASGKTRSE